MNGYAFILKRTVLSFTLLRYIHFLLGRANCIQIVSKNYGDKIKPKIIKKKTSLLNKISYDFNSDFDFKYIYDS